MPKPVRWIAGIVGVIFAALAVGSSVSAYHEFGVLGPVMMVTMFGGLYAVVLLGLAAVF